MRNAKIKNLKVGDIFLFPRENDFKGQSFRDALRMFGKVISKTKPEDKNFQHCWIIDYIDYDTGKMNSIRSPISRSHYITIYSEEEVDLIILGR
jgi:hypothetical protein